MLNTFEFKTRHMWQALSIMAYLGSLYFQDRVLRQPGGKNLADLLVFLTLSTTMVFCYQGYTCLSRGVRPNLILYIMSVMVVASSLLTLHGQRLTNTLTRVLFKSGKIIPTSILECIMNKSLPARRKIYGCAALVTGSALYFMMSIAGSTSGEGVHGLGIIFLLLGTVIDSALTCGEEHFFFKTGSYELDVYGVAFGCSFYGIGTLALFTWVFPVLHDSALLTSVHHIGQYKVDLAMFCAASALSYVLHFYFINHIGSLYADSFKAFRKVIALVVFGAVSHSFNGGPTVILSIAICAVGLYFIETGYSMVPEEPKLIEFSTPQKPALAAYKAGKILQPAELPTPM